MSIQKSAFSNSDFDSVIDDMASHFKSDKRQQSYSGGSDRLKALYDSADSVSFVDGGASQGSKSDNKVLNDLEKTARSELKAEAEKFQAKSTQYANDLKDSGNQDEFAKKIDKIRDEVKSKFGEVVDKWAVRAKEIHATNVLADLFLPFFKGLFALATKVFDSILDFFNRVVEWAGRALSAIRDFFSGLLDSVIKLA